MADLPVTPRLAKLLVEGGRLGAADQACAIAAVLSAGERGASDLLHLAESNWQPQTRRVYDQLRRRVRGKSNGGDQAVLAALLAAFPDRVARHRRDGELLLSSGGSAILPGCRSEFLIAVDVEDRRERGLPLVRTAAPIEPEMLLDRAVESRKLVWNRTALRVEEVTALLYGQLVIEESRHPAPPSEEASEMLAAEARQADVGRFVDRDALAQMEARAAFSGTPIDFGATLTAQCMGRTNFAELESADLLSALRPPHLTKSAPERLRLPGGREVKVHYEPGKPPWIESRLQDFFGVRETPCIGETPVVVHLLAPNYRPVQVTSDLAGFWERLYPQVRRELMRRYPKHKWPENP